MPWKRPRGRDGDQPDGSRNPMLELRVQLLELDPATAGLERSSELPRVFGGLVDMGYPDGAATLVALADGTTSLYTSTGGGVIGGGAH